MRGLSCGAHHHELLLLFLALHLLLLEERQLLGRLLCCVRHLICDDCCGRVRSDRFSGLSVLGLDVLIKLIDRRARETLVEQFFDLIVGIENSLAEIGAKVIEELCVNLVSSKYRRESIV